MLYGFCVLQFYLWYMLYNNGENFRNLFSIYSFSPFFVHVSPLYDKLWPKIATTVQMVCSQFTYIRILHAIRHQSAIKLSSFSGMFFFVCVRLFGFASRVAFFLWHIYCDHSLCWPCITYHTDCALFEYHFRICLVYVSYKNTRTNYMANAKWKRSTIVCRCVGACAYAYIVCLVKNKTSEWMNAK